MTVNEPEVERANIDDLLLDDSNPNVMTDQQMVGLVKSMEKYGYLTPVIIDQNNKVVDGEHRIIAYKEMGLKQIPIIRVNLKSEVERKQLRQIMNKLHGEHDKAKDSDELYEIMKASELGDLAGFLGKPEDEFMDLIKLFHGDDPLNDLPKDQKEFEVDMTEENSLKLTFKMPDQDSYVKVTSCLSKLSSESPEDALIKLVEEHEN